MALVFEQQIRETVALDIAKRMLIAARTAPKARGADRLGLAMASGDTIGVIAQQMRTMAIEGRGEEFFLRDADNLAQAQAVVLIGTMIEPLGLTKCGLCGYSDCTEKRQHPHHPCSFNTGDLGIAIGSAVSVAMEARVDNRVMFSIGMAARELGLLGPEVRIIYGIPLSVQSKNPFFDRKINPLPPARHL
ncbi:MAG: ferredoxin [Spirochaetae bacterium HGW-Spirochaetae-8]|jgi:uncharacterized ferredoxin-like protein|nr:MAG: ferredoxin [Spirochaetae bacterium HGW-Spirochaetae-8]